MLASEIQYIYSYMNRDPKTGIHQEDSRRYLRNIRNTYVFDACSGLYQPKAQKLRPKEDEDRKQSIQQQPIVITRQSEKTTDWPMFALGVAGLIVSALTVLLLFITVLFTKNQWQEARRSTFYTGQSADAATSAVGVARDTLIESQKSDVRQAAIAEQAGKDTKAASDAALARSDAALNATIENFHEEQRAWVGITPLRESVNSRGGVVITGDQGGFGIINTGKTPSTNVEVVFCGSFDVDQGAIPWQGEEAWIMRIIEAKRQGRLEGVDIIEGRVDPKRPRNFMPGFLFDASLVPPGQKTAWNGVESIHSINLGSLAPGIVYPSLIHGSILFIDSPTHVGTHLLFGEITYRDIYGTEERRTRFCEYRAPDTNGYFVACPIFNEMK